MSFVRLGYDIKCDSCGERLDSAHSNGGGLSKIGVANIAKEAGWCTCTKNQHLCPGCSKTWVGTCDCQVCREYKFEYGVK